MPRQEAGLRELRAGKAVSVSRTLSASCGAANKQATGHSADSIYYDDVVLVVYAANGGDSRPYDSSRADSF